MHSQYVFLQYSSTNEKVITIILSALYTSGWVGIGLSKNGKMLNASALVGWINEQGLPTISQYHLEGFTPSKIIPIKGDLPLTKEPPFVAVHGATIYLAFQLKFTSPLKDQPLLLAFGTKYPNYHRLTPHDDKKTLRFDFSSGSFVLFKKISLALQENRRLLATTMTFVAKTTPICDNCKRDCGWYAK